MLSLSDDFTYSLFNLQNEWHKYYLLTPVYRWKTLSTLLKVKESIKGRDLTLGNLTLVPLLSYYHDPRKSVQSEGVSYHLKPLFPYIINVENQVELCGWQKAIIPSILKQTIQ